MFIDEAASHTVVPTLDATTIERKLASRSKVYTVRPCRKESSSRVVGSSLAFSHIDCCMLIGGYLCVFPMQDRFGFYRSSTRLHGAVYGFVRTFLALEVQKHGGKLAKRSKSVRAPILIVW